MTYIEILTFKMGNVFEFEFIVLSSCDSDALSLSLTPLNITRLLEPPLMEFDVLSDDLKLFNCGNLGMASLDFHFFQEFVNFKLYLFTKTNKS